MRLPRRFGPIIANVGQKLFFSQFERFVDERQTSFRIRFPLRTSCGSFETLEVSFDCLPREADGYAIRHKCVRANISSQPTQHGAEVVESCHEVRIRPKKVYKVFSSVLLAHLE